MREICRPISLDSQILVNFDPVIFNTITDLASGAGGNRTQIVRDLVYTAIWEIKRNGAQLRKGPHCPKMFRATPGVRPHEGKIRAVDEFGLLIDEPEK